jgi:hypothetical protein
MAGSKDHTNISPDNIPKSAIEIMTANELQQYKDYEHVWLMPNLLHFA